MKAIVRNDYCYVIFIFRTIRYCTRKIETGYVICQNLVADVIYLLFLLSFHCKRYLSCIIYFYTAVSDEGSHDKHSKKELLGGKRKDKKDRKDRGYATLEGESSPDEDQETK